MTKGKLESTVIDHYAGPGEALTWASEGSEKWSRNIPGIDGALDAIQTNAGTPVLQLHDLAGDIVATVNDSEAETKLASTYNSTEFGVPQPGTTAPKYAWLGANGLATELSSGTATKGGASYVPQVARDLQTAPVVPPGAFPNGSGTGSENTAVIPGWSTALANAESAATLAEYTVEQEALRKKAEQEALETNERIAAERAEMEQIVAEEHPAPAEGGAEEVEETLGVGFKVGSGNASEAKYFDHEIEVSKFIAGELGNALFWTHHLGSISAGFFHVPSWLIQAVDAAADAKLVGGLDQLSANLLTAGSLASGPVTIHAYGDLNSYVWVDVDFPVDIGVDDG
jgi:hypothetical protein